jgi:hypothetical protein
MYVLLYTDTDNNPCYVQGTLAEINAHLHKAFVNEEVDLSLWDSYSPFQLLCIEDGALTPINSWEIKSIPQVVVN